LAAIKNVILSNISQVLSSSTIKITFGVDKQGFGGGSPQEKAKINAVFTV